MGTWATLEEEAPDLAAAGRRLIYRGGEALLATVRGSGSPRIHPINVGIVNGTLYAFIGRSAKGNDLEQDGRYALHAHVDPQAPDEFSLRGSARLIEDADVVASVANGWFFTVEETYRLFELNIDSAILGLRGPDEWPPR